MSWVSDYKYRWYETLAVNVLRAGGNIPRHIAFVMDGNRRYAKTAHLPQIDGHSRGFDKLADCLRWCLDIGIREVTAFAFSIENFKRSKEEVNGLLSLAREKFNKLLEDKEKLHKHGVRIRIIGYVNLLPTDVQQLIARAVLETECNDKLFLNIAFSYTSRDEITQAVESILLHGENLHEEDISACLLEECMYTRSSSPPDLLIRTSGETRISDFLMWQLSTTVLYFTKILWPELSIWHFLSGIYTYQCASSRMNMYRSHFANERNLLEKNTNFCCKRVQTFLTYLDSYRKNVLLKLYSTN